MLLGQPWTLKAGSLGKNKADALVDTVAEKKLWFLSLGGHAEGDTSQGREPTATHTAPRGPRDRVDMALGLAYF